MIIAFGIRNFNEHQLFDVAGNSSLSYLDTVVA